MLANFLNKSKPINYIVFLALFFIGFMLSVYHAFFVDEFLADNLLKSSVLFLLFLIVFFVFNFINSKNKLTFDNSYSYFFFTLLLVWLLPNLLSYKVLFLTFIYLLFLRKLYSLHSFKNVLTKLFDSGFWLGIFFVLEPFSIVLFVLIYLAVYLYNKITIHTIFAPIVGFITPLILYFTYFFWYDKPEEFTGLFDFSLHFNLQFYSNLKFFWLIIGLLIFTVFTILIKSIKVLPVNNTFRKSWILLIYNFILSLFFIAILQDKNGAELIYMMFPVAIILANGIEIIQRNIIRDIVLYFFLAASIAFWL